MTLSRGTACGTISAWASVEKIVSGMRDKPKKVRYEDLNKVCEHYFGSPRTTGGSHAVCPATFK